MKILTIFFPLAILLFSSPLSSSLQITDKLITAFCYDGGLDAANITDIKTCFSTTVKSCNDVAQSYNDCKWDQKEQCGNALNATKCLDKVKPKEGSDCHKLLTRTQIANREVLNHFCEVKAEHVEKILQETEFGDMEECTKEVFNLNLGKCLWNVTTENKTNMFQAAIVCFTKEVTQFSNCTENIKKILTNAVAKGNAGGNPTNTTNDDNGNAGGNSSGTTNGHNGTAGGNSTNTTKGDNGTSGKSGGTHPKTNNGNQLTVALFPGVLTALMSLVRRL